jgi:hypothetical protein
MMEHDYLLAKYALAMGAFGAILTASVLSFIAGQASIWFAAVGFYGSLFSMALTQDYVRKKGSALRLRIKRIR